MRHWNGSIDNDKYHKEPQYNSQQLYKQNRNIGNKEKERMNEKILPECQIKCHDGYEYGWLWLWLWCPSS